MSRSPVHTLRLATLAEGVSFLVLLFVGMPLKYWADLPLAVKITGWLHGLLFVIVCALLLAVTLKERWPLSRTALVFAAALIPFGPFWIDHRLKDYEVSR
jgi:integral membrane protein